MKYIVIFLVLIGLAGFVIPQAFSVSENLFSGIATFERLPATISPNTEAKFEIKFQYTKGAYSLSNVTAIADITPKGAVKFVHFDAEPFDVYQNSIARIPVTISVDPSIEYEKIFLNISYVGTGINGASFKSSWSDSLVFDIIPNELTEISLNNCSHVDLESAIYGGILQFVCHSSVTNSVRAIINADSDGIVTLEIPKFLLYSLTDSQCNVSNDFLVLVKGREVASEITDNETTNSVTLDFAKGITEIEIMGTTILPDPSPAQYCGIVEGYEKQFLAPLDQTDRGVKAEFIRCNVGLVLTQRIDDSPACVKPESIPKLIERGWTAKNDSTLPKINTSCMTIEQSKETAPFFKTPSYLPEGYSYVCSRSGMPFESYIVYYNQEFPTNWQIHELVSDGAIFIYQTDERNFVDEKEYATYGSPEQRTRETYDSVIEGNPSLNPQLITINGMLAYAVDSCPDCGMQIANFTDGSSIQKSTSTETKIKFIDENGVKYMLKTTLPLSELIKVAESLQ